MCGISLIHFLASYFSCRLGTNFGVLCISWKMIAFSVEEELIKDVVNVEKEIVKDAVKVEKELVKDVVNVEKEIVKDVVSNNVGAHVYCNTCSLV